MIAQAQSEALQATHSKIRFANMISHEMRAPLNFIIGATDLMVNAPESYGDTKWPSSLQEDLLRVYQSSQHLTNLIDDVLTLGQIDANRMALVFADCSVDLIIREVEGNNSAIV